MNLHELNPIIPDRILLFTQAWASLGHHTIHTLWYNPETQMFGYWYRGMRDQSRVITEDTIQQWQDDRTYRHIFSGEADQAYAQYITIIARP